MGIYGDACFRRQPELVTRGTGDLRNFVFASEVSP